MATCKSCNSYNVDSARFCNSCGAPIEVETQGVAFPPPAQPIPPAQPFQPYQPVQPQYPYALQKPLKDKSIAIILEILPGLFGFLGIGWFYSGNTTAGVLWLAGFLFWTVIATVISVLTAGIGVICWLPISLGCVIFSTISLNSYIKKHPEVFGI